MLMLNPKSRLLKDTNRFMFVKKNGTNIIYSYFLVNCAIKISLNPVRKNF